MCGISVLLGMHPLTSEELWNLQHLIWARGRNNKLWRLQYVNRQMFKMSFFNSVLHMRGDQMPPQPVRGPAGSILLFNGEIYYIQGRHLDTKQSDSAVIASALESCETKEQIVEAFASIDGPFAFIYYNIRTQCLFYGRDIFGRKSLCTLEGERPYPLGISSVTAPFECDRGLTWSEVPTIGFFCIDLSRQDRYPKTVFLWDMESMYPRTAKCQPFTKEPRVEYKMLKAKPIVPLNPDPRRPEEFSDEERAAAIDSLGHKILSAVRRHFIYNNTLCRVCRYDNKERETEPIGSCDHENLAVAFSGGLDSTIIAVAMHKILNRKEPIDLVGVSFRDGSHDREATGRAFNELKQMYPNRPWRLIFCDHPEHKIVKYRNFRIKRLIAPRNTVIDDSLGCAGWFIGRADGNELANGNMLIPGQEGYLPFPIHKKLGSRVVCPAAIMLLGSGIDEQLGGYASHRKAWLESGAEGVNNEIAYQMRRISSRNMGRDDRVYSDHGREIKIPYLDFQLVNFLNQLPVGLKMSLDESLDKGPKKILRGVAMNWKMTETASRVKKALQFGTGIAKLENPRERGGDTCSRLTETDDNDDR